MTIRDMFQQLSGRLRPLYTDREARYIAQLVLEKVTGHTRTDLVMRPQTPIGGEQETRLDGMLVELLQQRPLQYVLGESWFYRLPFRVKEGVLIPRPETEELVAWILEDLQTGSAARTTDTGQPFTLLDIGTGSGCIAIALKKNLPEARVAALDLSPLALDVTRENAASLGVSLDLIQADILDPGSRRKLPPVDLIVSNPPYIPLKEKAAMQTQVTGYEPSAALFVPDDDPFRFYRAILETARLPGKDGVSIYVEIHADAGAAVTDLFRQSGAKEVRLRKDLHGLDRMVFGRL